MIYDRSLCLTCSLLSLLCFFHSISYLCRFAVFVVFFFALLLSALLCSALVIDVLDLSLSSFCISRCAHLSPRCCGLSIIVTTMKIVSFTIAVIIISPPDSRHPETSLLLREEVYAWHVCLISALQHGYFCTLSRRKQRQILLFGSVMLVPGAYQ